MIKGKWKEIKGEILTLWGKMTDDELDKTSGNLTSITGLIQQRYGDKKEKIQEKLHDIVSRITEKTENLKNSIRDTSSHT